MSHPDKAPQPPIYDQEQPDQAVDLMEAQLQQELRSMFAVDTQEGLETYLDQASRLSEETWAEDIQTLYRTVHTIKGGSVTVGADGILQVATVLEDLLSDLRHHQTAPPLTDGQLAEILVEAGELLASTLSIDTSGEQLHQQVQPSVQRIQQLRQTIRERYLPQWSEQQQLHQEFAQQGLELVVLDLEIALENLTQQGPLPPETIRTAQAVLQQLAQIGQDLQLAEGWSELLEQAETLCSYPDIALWQQEWPRLFQALKSCAQAGGDSVDFELAPLTDLSDVSTDALMPLEDDLEGLTAVSSFLDSLDYLEGAEETASDWSQESPVTDSLVDPLAPDAAPETNPDQLARAGDFLEAPDTWIVEPSETPPEELMPAVINQEATATVSASSETHPAPTGGGASLAADLRSEQVQIPVPLAKLDQSAQDLINTLMSVRSTHGVYQTLQGQIVQLVALAQEGVQQITRLRQIQDDYALIDNLKLDRREPYQGPTPERYRQGYTTINRLLETSLRLSELGAEAEKTAKQMTDNLQFLDANVLKLQNTVEDSRLVPFRNLAFRARAILRDLSTRFQKPARLEIEGERTELDVGSASSLEPALLHLIRNAFDHALESPAERQALDKPQQGTLCLSLHRQGSTYQLDVRDDGRGIDAEAVRARAEALKLPLTHTGTAADLLAVICQPGFSSETQVSEISGRGVGMDVVAAQISRLGGRLSLETSVGQGTTFHLQFPVPHLLVPCVLLQAGEATFAVPIEDIRTTSLLETLEVSPAEEASPYSWQVEREGRSLAGLDLMDYWQPQLAGRPLEPTSVCTFIQSAAEDHGAWLMADDLLGQADLIINPVPAPLQAPTGLMGMSLQPDGSLVPVLNPTALVEWIYAAPAATTPLGADENSVQETYAAAASILIVDDAALMRRRLEASLNAYGHITHTCGDGLEAWNWLQSNPQPALIITDIEMPNMDGFTLIDRCRQAEIQVPILVVSSRLSEDWFDEARRLGANDYLTKGFSTLELTNKVSQLMDFN